MHDWRRDGSAKKSALHGILQATGGGVPKRRKRNKTEKQERGKDRENIGSSLGACLEERYAAAKPPRGREIER